MAQKRTDAQQYASVWRRFKVRHLATVRQRTLASVGVVVALVGVVAPVVIYQQHAAAWWSNSWGYRRKITFNNAASGSNLVNFTVRVSLTSSNIDYNNTQDSGQDIRFVDSDDTTVLSYEIERWNEAGTSEVWVKVPQIDVGSTTDFIYMYYGNPVATDGQDVNGTWDANYSMVHHFGSGTGTPTDYHDSTSNANNVTSGSYAGSSSSGQIDRAASFNGASTSLNVADDPTIDNLSNMTVSTWIKPSDDVTPGNMIYKEQTTSPWYAYMLENYNSGFDFQVTNAAGTATKEVDSTTNPAANTWYNVVGTYASSGTMKIYVNGVDVTTGTTGTVTGNLYNSNSSLWLGYQIKGLMDETRLSTVARSADWIKADYLSQNNAFNTFGSQEAYSGGGGSGWWNASWTYRRKITFDNSGSNTNLVNFPVRVSLTSTEITYANTKAAGADIRFVDSDDTTALSYEIEQWNSSGTSEIWVKVPQIDANSTTDFIYMYYGNSGASDGQAASSVWNSNYTDVLHLSENPGAVADGYKDSTSNGSNGRGGGGTGTMVPARSTGEIGYGQDFDGSNDSIGITANTQLFNANGNFTVEMWIKPDDCGDPNSGQATLFEQLQDHGEMYICRTTRAVALYFNNSGTEAYTGSNAFAFSSWQHLAIVHQSNNVTQVYINGSPVTMSDGTVAGDSSTSSAAVLGQDSTAGNSSSYNYDGGMDEVRISNTNRSDDWLQASYLSESNQMNTFGAEETNAGSGGGGGGTNSPDTWWNSAWSFRRKITMDNSASGTTLYNFPVRVSLNASRVDYSSIQSGGADIRFVSPDGNTTYSYEIEQWNSSGTSEIWVNVPALANNNTQYMFMYYGNASASDAQNPYKVWNPNYFIVQHENNASGSNVADSSFYGHTGTPNATGHPVPTTSGKIGSAFNFLISNGNDFYTMQQHTGVLDNYTDTVYSIQAWVKPSSIPTTSGGTQDYAIAGKRGKFSGLRVAYNSGSNAKIIASVYDSGSGAQTATSTTLVTANNWYFAEMVADVNSSGVGTLRLYINGVQEGTGAIASMHDYWPTDTSNSNQWPIVGRADPATGGGVTCSTSFIWCMDGTIDEVRYSDVARSADWVKAEYVTESDAMNTYGTKEIYPPDAPVLTALGTSESTTPTFQLRASDQHSPDYLKYEIQVCSNSDCSSVVRTIDQTASQTGWTGQNAATSTAYTASSTLASSTLASHTYQAPALTAGTQYWWRAYAIDPNDSNNFGPASAIGTFTTQGKPSAPTLARPISGIIVDPNIARFEASSTDPNADYLKYKFQICDASDCSSVVRTVDQTSSQTGWTAQNASSNTAYSSSATTGQSARGVYMYQSPFLTANTQYWWRAYAIDPGGSNTWSNASSIGTFTTGNGIYQTRVTGGTTIKGGTVIGH